jgi:hypothetical protein
MRSTTTGLDYAKNLINDIVKEQHNHPCIAAWVLGSENGTFMLQNGNKLLNAISPVDMTRPTISNLDSIYIDNEGNFRKDTGKLLPVSVDRISQFASLSVRPRMTPNAAYTHYLAHCFNKDEEELMVPDSGFGDSHFQDGEDSSATDVSNKMLVTIKNHTLLPNSATNIKGPRGVKNQKAVKNTYKAIETFVKESGLSVWDSVASFIECSRNIATKSKLDQITAFQSNPQISGFFLEQWADFGTDFCGICDENRKSKGLEEFCKEITTPSRVLISELEHVVAPQSEVSFQLTLLNNDRLENVSVDVSLIDASGKELNKQEMVPEETTGKTSLTQLGICTLMSPRNTGKFQIRITLKDNGKEVHSSTEDLIVMESEFCLREGNVKEMLEQSAELNRRRAEKQPLDEPSAGSAFKRPANDYASRLVDACGLKGMRVGGARVSEKHAGFLVNQGTSSADFLALVREVQRIVLEKTGVQLEMEIRVIGVEEKGA